MEHGPQAGSATPGARPLLALAAFAGVALALVAGHARLLSQTPPGLLGTLPDDTFYYLQIARHLAAGHGPTFDGVHPASGYHPGWMALLVPLAAALRDPVTLLRGALALGLVLHLATATALAGLFRRYTTPGLAALGALCWLANPFALHLSLLGLESALYMLCLVLVLRATASFVADPPSLRSHLKLGVALALCFLARTEAGVLALLTCATAPVFKGWRPASRPWLRSAFLLGATFTLCVAPWFLYCWIATGSPWQSSGVAKSLWAAPFLQPLSASERLARAVDVMGRVWLAPPWSSREEPPVSPFVWAAMIPAAAGLLLAVRRSAEERTLIAASAWLLTITAATGLVYGLVYWHTPIWYRAQPGLLLFLITYAWITRASAALADRWKIEALRVALPLLLLAVSLFGAFGIYRQPPVSYPWQRDFYESREAFERLVPPGEAIGCFNAGLAGYFSQRRIVNLDGLVNNAVVPYYRARTLDRYFADEGLHYLADDTSTLEQATRFMTRPLRLQPLACVPLHGTLATRRCLWRVG